MDTSERWIELEVKSAYQERRIADLDAALVDQAQRIDALEDTVRALQEALRRLHAARPGPHVAGALPEEDPVPRSG